VKRFAVLWVFIAAACGKVGPPQPPIVRTPQQVSDLKVAQNGYHVVLAWTNPGAYVDGNPATDISTVRILQNGVVVATEPASGPGQRQSKEIDISKNLNSELSFDVVIGTERGKSSNPSNPAPIRPVEVPGPPRALKATVDQLRIILDWEAPERNANLASVYLVSRSDRATPVVATGLHFEDAEYEQDVVYTYTVTAAIGETGQTPGVNGPSTVITATDHTMPLTPVGLTFQRLDMEEVFLQWTPNKERDLKEYLVFRTDQPREPICRGRAEACRDPNYRAGLMYQLEAVDRFENHSLRSAPTAVP